MSSNRSKTKLKARNRQSDRSSDRISNVKNPDNTQQFPAQEIVDSEESSSFKEYEMMRTEILQYLEEYQSVRNMMYLATATILSVNSFMFQSYYLFLLPLIIIFPSYMIFYNYWKSVSCASTYIQVFLEDDAVQRTYHWELRLRYFSELQKSNQMGAGDKLRNLDMHSHQIPYLLCTYLCLALYWIHMLWKYIGPCIRETVGDTWLVVSSAFRAHFLVPEGYCLMATWHVLIDILLGLVLSISLSCIFKECWNINTIDLTRTWERVKKIDTQHEDALRQELGLHPRKGNRV